MSATGEQKQSFKYDHLEWLFIVHFWILKNKPSNPKPPLISHLESQGVLQGYVQYCQDNYDTMEYLIKECAPAYKNYLKNLAK